MTKKEYKDMRYVVEKTQADIDRECIAAVKRGAVENYSIIVKTYMKRAYYIALGFVKNDQDALDISQNAFIKAYRHIRKFSDERNFFPWFYQILRNTCLDWLRKHNKRDTVPLEDLPLASPEGMDEGVRIILWKNIDQLKMEQKEIIILRYFQSFSYQEIAETLNKPIGSVMSALYYAKQQLRKNMGGLLK